MSAVVERAHERERDVERDRGSITAFVVCLVLTFAVCAGLAVDGGRLVGARVTAADQAENAARAGAQEVVSIRAGEWRIDPARAKQTALAFLAAQGASGTVTATTTRVTVTVRRTVPYTLLRLAGLSGSSVSATRSSDPVSR